MTPSDLLERLTAALADRYGVERELGRGGMAVVYLAEDSRHHRQVALKVLHPELTATLGAERFLHEIETVASLNHPHILPLHDSGEADGLLYYVMPYAEGESLRQRLDRERQLAVDESVRIAIEVADGLDYAHRKGVVHRDIKPGNILLSEHHAVIADFGIARAIEVARADRVTSTGLGVGTPLYASPEQATAQETLDGRTDIYSLGCVLYEMLAGQPPLTGATPQIIQARRVSETPSALHDLRDTVPPALDHVIARALARIPADRYATASQFGQALQAAIFAATPMAQVDVTPAAVGPTPQAPTARRRWSISLLAAVGVVVAIAGALWFTRGASGDGSLEIRTSNILQVTRAEGLEFQPAISPNGEEVAYVVGPVGSPRVVVRSTLDIGGGGESRLAEDEVGRHSQPAWTADGAVRFFSFVPGFGWSWKEVGKLGGTVRTVPRPHAGNNKLSPDGSRVVFRRRDSIFVYAADYGDPELLGVHGKSWSQHSFAWSPDGQWIAYVSGNPLWLYGANVSGASIWILSADGGEPVRVTDEDYLNVSPQWLPDSRHLLFMSNRDGPRDIYVVEVGPDGPRGLPTKVPGASDPHSVSVSANGRKLAYSKFTARQNIWAVPIPRSGLATVRDAVPITAGNQIIEGCSLSPDGEWIAFGSDIQGEFDIYRMSLDEGGPHQIAEFSGTVFAPEWSPDGTEIAFYAQQRGESGYQVFVVSAAGGAPEQVTRLEGEGHAPDWTPDGLTLAFSSSEAQARRILHIWTVSRDSLGASWGEPVELTDLPCGGSDWAPDGASLVCDAGTYLAIVSRDGEVIARLETVPPVNNPNYPRFSDDGARIYFRGIEEDGSEGIWSIPSSGGSPAKVMAFDDPSLTVFSGFTVGPENFYLTLSEYESDIWVMDLDW